MNIKLDFETLNALPLEDKQRDDFRRSVQKAVQNAFRKCLGERYPDWDCIAHDLLSVGLLRIERQYKNEKEYKDAFLVEREKLRTYFSDKNTRSTGYAFKALYWLYADSGEIKSVPRKSGRPLSDPEEILRFRICCNKAAGLVFEKFWSVPIEQHRRKRPRSPSRIGPTAPFKWPDHISKEDAKRKDAPDGIWLNPHNHHSIPLSGRTRERRLLTDFIERDRHFLIAALVAPSGAGKTRLVSEWMRGYMACYQDNGWDAGFVDSRDPLPWSEENWQPTKNTLVIIDYTYNYDEVIDSLMKRFDRDAPRKIRILLLDHVVHQFGKMHHSLALGRTFPDAGDVDAKLDAFFDPYPIELKPEGDKSELLRDVIASAADPNDTRHYTRNSPIVVRAFKELMSIGDVADANPTDDQVRRRNSICHPLFAALVGQAIAENPDQTFAGWSRRDLITRYFERKRRVPWEEDDRNKHAQSLGRWVGCYVSAATLLRGASIDQLQRCLPKPLREDLSGEHWRWIGGRANEIVNSDDDRVLKPFEPDILGEAFLLKFLEEFAERDEVIGTLTAMVGSTKNADQALRNAIVFLETIQRLARNLANDAQGIQVTEGAWRILLNWLKPKRFKKHSVLRQAVSIALVKVAEAFPKLEMPDEYRECLERIVAKDLLSATDTLLFREATSALMFFDDMVRQTLGYGDATDDAMLLAAFQRFEERDTRGSSALILACEFGKVSCAKRLIEDGAEIDKGNAEGTTGFMLACSEGHECVVSILIQKGAQVDKSNIAGVTGFMMSCWSGHDNVVLQLIHKVDIEKSAFFGETAFIMACRHGRESVVEKLIEVAEIEKVNGQGYSGFMLACQNGHENVVSLLMDKVKIEGKTEDGFTGFSLACYYGRENVVTRLTDKANIEAKTENGHTGFMLACQNGHADVVTRLIDKADIEAKTERGVTGFMLACQNGHADVVSLLIDIAKIDVKTDDCVTAFMQACYFGHEKVASRLIDKANIEAETEDGHTGFVLACRNGHADVVSLLIDRAKMNAKTIHGHTGFMLACQNGHADVVSLLIGKDDIEAETEDGITGLMLACENGHADVVSLLIDKVKIETKNSKGGTALVTAIVFEEEKITELLLDSGANPNVISNEHGSALDIAMTTENSVIISLLLMYNAKSERELM